MAIKAEKKNEAEERKKGERRGDSEEKEKEEEERDNKEKTRGNNRRRGSSVGGTALAHCHLRLQPRSRHCEPTRAAAPPRSQCREGRTLKEGEKYDIEMERKKNKAETQQKKKNETVRRTREEKEEE